MDIDGRFDDLLKAARQADKIDRERAELFVGMLNTEAWKTYVEVLNLQLQGISDQLLRPAQSLDGMVLGEYLKGAMCGIMLARDLPGATIESMKAPTSDSEEPDVDA